MVTVFMLSRRLWSFQLPDEEHSFFETCGAAIRSLIGRGLARDHIDIDYETGTAPTRARETAKRFIAAYGARGARFMPAGELQDGDECPPLPDGVEEHRALRKLPRVCPHCGKAVRKRDWLK